MRYLLIHYLDETAELSQADDSGAEGSAAARELHAGHRDGDQRREAVRRRAGPASQAATVRIREARCWSATARSRRPGADRQLRHARVRQPWTKPPQKRGTQAARIGSFELREFLPSGHPSSRPAAASADTDHHRLTAARVGPDAGDVQACGLAVSVKRVLLARLADPGDDVQFGQDGSPGRILRCGRGIVCWSGCPAWSRLARRMVFGVGEAGIDRVVQVEALAVPGGMIVSGVMSASWQASMVPSGGRQGRAADAGAVRAVEGERAAGPGGDEVAAVLDQHVAVLAQADQVDRLVRPPRLQYRMWCRSMRRDSQPGNLHRQVSRSRAARRSAARAPPPAAQVEDGAVAVVEHPAQRGGAAEHLGGADADRRAVLHWHRAGSAGSPGTGRGAAGVSAETPAAAGCPSRRPDRSGPGRRCRRGR